MSIALPIESYTEHAGYLHLAGGGFSTAALCHFRSLFCVSVYASTVITCRLASIMEHPCVVSSAMYYTYMYLFNSQYKCWSQFPLGCRVPKVYVCHHSIFNCNLFPICIFTSGSLCVPLNRSLWFTRKVCIHNHTFFTFSEILFVRNLILDWFSYAFFIWNFGCMGLMVIHWKGPLRLQQAYLILTSALVVSSKHTL
jgi:hypothetical protein